METIRRDNDQIQKGSWEERNQKRKIIAICAVIIMLLIPVILILVSLRNKNTSNTSLYPTPSQTPKLEGIKEALPQNFLQKTLSTGILIVFSNVNDIRVMIDASDTEGPSSHPQIPINTTPFKMSSIPVGEHTLLASKPGYSMVEKNLKIIEGKITYVTIELSPLPTNGAYYHADQQNKSHNN